MSEEPKTEEELNRWITAKLEQLSDKKGVPYDGLRQMFDKAIVYFKDDEQLKEPLDLYKYVFQIVLSRTQARPRLNEYKLILFGDSGVSKTGKAHNFYAFGNIGGVSQTCKLVFLKETQSKADDLDLFRVYRCQLPATGEKSRVFFVDKYSTFEPLQDLPLKDQKLNVINKIGAEVIKAKNAELHLSALNKNNRTDDFDLKVIKGIAENKRDILRSDGTSRISCDIMDVVNNGEKIDFDVLPLRVWAPETLDDFDDDDQIICVGTVSKNTKTGFTSMNAVSIVPILKRSFEEEF